MRKTLSMLAALCALGLAGPAPANFVREPTFEEKMAAAQLVVIGTVTAVDPIQETATLSVLSTLKGASGPSIIVTTHSAIAELDPRCCATGATYIMFLSSGPGGRPGSVWGAYGMIRIGAPAGQGNVAIPPSRFEN